MTGLDAKRDWKRHLDNYRGRFVDRYPDLGLWLQRPLRERIGWRNGESQSRRQAPDRDFDYTAGWINHQARPYLIYLGLTGRIHLDWGWLLGIGILKPWPIADGLVDRQAADWSTARGTKYRDCGIVYLWLSM